MSVLGLKLQRKPHYNFIAGKLEPNVVCISIIVSYPGNKSILYRLNHIDSDEKCFITLWQPKASLLFFPLSNFQEIVNYGLFRLLLASRNVSVCGGEITEYFVLRGVILTACSGFKC